MKQRPRIYYSDSQKALMWERWKQGWTLHEIGKLFDRAHSSIHPILAETGGIRPAQRSRPSTALTLAEREEISRAMVAGESVRSTAVRLGRAPSTISREIKRNGGRSSYRANQADDAAWDRARRPKRCKLSENRALASIVAGKLRMLWSPEQIAGWLKHTYPCDESHHVSHETIYRSLFIQARGALKKELLAHLRRTRGMRRSRHYTQKTATHGQIVDAVSISERPACVEDRAVPGHWEGDLVFGSGNSQIATLVERQTRYDQARWQGLADSRQRPHQERSKAAARALQITDLGSRQRDGRAQALHDGHRHPGLLLRSAKPVATRKQREHKWAAQAVHAQGNESLRLLTDSTQCDCETIEPKAAQDARLPHAR
jgi:IS30 family transposase